jgi:SAP domain
MRLVRTNSRFAGGPPVGQVGWMDDETAEILIERGAAVDCSSLARREGRPERETGPWVGITDDELRQACEALDLPTAGPRHLLIERLEAHVGPPPIV